MSEGITESEEKERDYCFLFTEQPALFLVYERLPISYAHCAGTYVFSWQLLEKVSV
jgi:hypothetical protein